MKDKFYLSKKTNDEIDLESQILKANIFKEHIKQKSGSGTQADASISVNIVEEAAQRFSIFDFLEEKVEKMELKTFQLMDQSSEYKFYQVKPVNSQSLMNDFKVIQIIDVTAQVLYDNTNAEVKLLQLINACVSHEMRNPLNAIHCQNIYNDEINNKIEKVLENE